MRLYENIDCMVGMKNFPDKYFDLAIVDPPYGINESSKNHKSRNTPVRQKNGSILKVKDPVYVRKNWDNSPPDDSYFDELFRVSKNQIIFGANYFTQIAGTAFKAPRKQDFQRFLWDNPSNWILWDKVRSGDFNDCELAWTSFDVPSIKYTFMWNGMLQGKSISEGHLQQGNKKLNEKRYHPTQKPKKLYIWLCLKFAKPGFIMLDTHAGRGNSIEVFEEMNLDYYASEIDHEMFQLSSDLINKNRMDKSREVVSTSLWDLKV